MDKFKTVLIFMLVGALLGIGVAALTVPHYVAWNNSAPMAQMTQCNLPEVIASTSSQLVHGQLIGAGVGALLFLVLGVVFIQVRKKKDLEAPPPPVAPTAPAS